MGNCWASDCPSPRTLYLEDDEEGRPARVLRYGAMLWAHDGLRVIRIHGATWVLDLRSLPEPPQHGAPLLVVRGDPALCDRILGAHPAISHLDPCGVLVPI